MPEHSPKPITAAEKTLRLRRVTAIARRLGFVGRVEYWHVYNQSGGAQYGLAANPEQDLLTDYAEAFERDADPEEFSLDASIAHERAHQLLARHPRLRALVAGRISLASEEALASVLGATLSLNVPDKDMLLAKAVVELLRHGDSPEKATRLIGDLLDQLEQLL